MNILFSWKNTLIFSYILERKKMNKQTQNKLLIYQKYVDLVDYGYNLLIKYPKIEKYYLVF